MMRSKLLLFALLSGLAFQAQAQTGPWAKFDDRMRGNALYRDASGGDLESVKSIIAGGGDVNWEMSDGETALMTAAAAGHLDIVRYLLGQGADPNMRDDNGRSALDYAKLMGTRAVVRELEGVMGVATPPRPNPPAAPATAPAAPRANPPAPPRANPPAPPRANPPARPPAPNPPVAAAAGRGGWPAFGRFKVGDRVQFLLSTGWHTGVIRELGVPGPTQGRAEWSERRYRIADDRWNDGGEWHDWGTVAPLERQPWWTGFFVGDWKLGEVMAVNTRIKGHVEETEYSYHTATDALHVAADGSYRWKTLRGKEIRGRWVAAPDGPGIILQRGDEGVDWTFRNETNATEENIRGIQTARLKTPGKMSVAAKRPLR